MSYTFSYRPHYAKGPPPIPVVPRSRFPVPEAPKQVVRRVLPVAPLPVAPPPKGMSRRVLRMVEEVAAKHRLTVPIIMGTSRDVASVAARHEAWWTVWRETGLSYPRLGALFRRDHSSILHGVRKHQAKVAASGPL